MEHDPLDCNIAANVFLLLYYPIYHPLWSQQVHLSELCCLSVEILVSGSVSLPHFPPVSLHWHQHCHSQLQQLFITSTLLFSTFCFYTGPIREPRPKNTWIQNIFPTDLGTHFCWLSWARCWIPEASVSKKNGILDGSSGQFIVLSPLSQGCGVIAPCQLTSPECTPENTLWWSDKIVLLAVRKG